MGGVGCPRCHESRHTFLCTLGTYSYVPVLKYFSSLILRSMMQRLCLIDDRYTLSLDRKPVINEYSSSMHYYYLIEDFTFHYSLSLKFVHKTRNRLYSLINSIKRESEPLDNENLFTVSWRNQRWTLGRIPFMHGDSILMIQVSYVFLAF